MTRPVRRTLPLLALVALASPATAADYPLVPGDAAAVLTVDVKSVLKSPTVELAKVGLDGLKPGEWEAFVKTLPFDPAAVERITVIAPTGAAVGSPQPRGGPTSVSSLVAITLGKKFDAAEVLKGYGAGTRRKVYAGVPYQFDDESWSGIITLPGDTTLVVGSEDAVVWYIDRLQAKDKKDSPFTAALADADKHAVQLLVNPAALGAAKKDAPPDFAPLLDAKLGVLTVDVGKGLKLHARLEYETEAGAKDGVKAVKAVAAKAREGLKGGIDSLEKQALKPEAKGGLSDASSRMMMMVGLGALRRLDAELEAFPVEQKGTAAVVAYDDVKVPEWAVLPGVMAGSVSYSLFSGSSAASVGKGPDFQEEEKRRKKLFDALAAYEQKNGQYPPAVVKDKKGQPLYSWRVALLPYLGEDDLYKQFKLDEPWDSLHNKKLIAKLPKVYEPNYVSAYNAGRTRVLAVVGPGTIFDPKAKVTANDIKEPADTLLWVEASNLNDKYFDGVYWTKPFDAEFDGDKPPDLFGKYEYGSFSGMTADGKWRYVNKRDDAKKLPGLFLREKK